MFFELKFRNYNTSMKPPIYISILFLIFARPLTYGQNKGEVLEKQKEKDSTEVVYYIIEGDTIARDYIDLDEVFLLHKLRFENEEDRRRYLILRRKTKKVYPYAKLAAERLTVMNERLSTLHKKSARRKYTKRVQKYVE